MSSQLPGLTLRRVRPNDSHDLFRWRNDEITRAYSINSEKIALYEHVRWFQNKIQETSCLLIIGEISNLAIGMVRLDVDDETHQCNVSINIDPASRGKGISKIFLKEAITYAEKTFLLPIAFNAEIHAKNIPSKRIFESNGFKKIGAVPGTQFEKYQLLRA